jgi:glucoamylase
MRYAIAAGLLGLSVATALAAAPNAAGASGVAPGAPGARALWTAGNKDGFGTATTSASKVWYTLGGGELTEVYYPNLGTPATRDLQFVVTDGKSWIERDQDTDHKLTLTDPRSLSYQQVDTDPSGRYRITKT